MNVDLWAPVGLGLWHSEEVRAAALACDDLYRDLAGDANFRDDGVKGDSTVALSRTVELVRDVLSADHSVRTHVLFQYARRAGWWRLPVSVASIAAALICSAESEPDKGPAEPHPVIAAAISAGLGWIDLDGTYRGMPSSPDGRWLILDGARVQWISGAAEPASLIDPSFGLVSVRTRGEPLQRWLIDESAAHEIDALVQLLVAADALGAAERAWALARDHSLDRVQFGRKLSEFQAIRLALANNAVELIGAAAALATACDELGACHMDDVAEFTFRTTYEVARFSTHVFGASGYTAELPVGWQFMRTAGARGLVSRSILEREHLVQDGS